MIIFADLIESRLEKGINVTYIDALRKKIADIKCVDELTEAQMWNKHGTVIWQAKKFVGNPSFYPVYKWGDYYSYSVLAYMS